MKTLWSKISGKVGAILTAILGIAGFILFFLKKPPTTKVALAQQLEIVKSQIEITKLEEQKQENVEKLEVLNEKEKQIREKIQEIESGKISEDQVSPEELDKFFDSRGF